MTASQRNISVAVTGAGGFIGRALCERLLADGFRVKGLVRRSSVVTCGVVRVEFDSFFNRLALTRALERADVVFHLAGRAHVLSDRAANPLNEFRIANVESTRALLDACAEVGVRRFVLVSSIAAVCSSSPVPVNERTAPNPDTNYGRSKLEAERLVAAADDVETVIARPSTVIGPGMKGNPLRLFDFISRGLPVPTTKPINQRTILYVENLVAALILLGTDPRAKGDVFHIGDIPPLSTGEMCRMVASALGVPCRELSVPVTILRAGGVLGDLFSRFFPRGFTSATLKSLSDSLIVDSKHLRERLGYAPPVSLEDGMERTAQWYRKRAVDSRGEMRS